MCATNHDPNLVKFFRFIEVLDRNRESTTIFDRMRELERFAEHNPGASTPYQMQVYSAYAIAALWRELEKLSEKEHMEEIQWGTFATLLNLYGNEDVHYPLSMIIKHAIEEHGRD